MRKFIQYYDYGVMSGNLIASCGSDAVHILDGRWSLENCITEGHKQAYRLRNIREYVGFKVFYGSRYSSAWAKTDLIEIKYPDEFCIKRGYDYGGIAIP